jgi:hypothetical protein
MPATVFKLRDGKLVLSENDVERQICDFLRRYGWYAVRNHVGAFVPYAKHMRAMAGKALGRKDIVAINEEGTADWLFTHGAFPPIWVEVKAPGKTPSTKQLLFLEKMRLLNMFAVWTDRYEDFEQWYYDHVSPSAHNFHQGQGGLKAQAAEPVDET